jgi:hypothetical protein
MNVISAEGQSTNKDTLCLCVITIFMAGRYKAFVTPPQVDARPIDAFFRRDLDVSGTEVVEDSDSDRAARQRHVRRVLLCENFHKKAACISGHARNDARFVILNNESAVRQHLSLRQEG